jgi:ribosomal protein S24E
LSIPEESIKIKKIYGKFGSKDFIIDANIYETEEHKKRTEKKLKKKKGAAKTEEVKK